ALSKYKKIDAPGKSMNNMPSIDSVYTGDIWERKRQFLKPYKFTISFENNSYPGYQTEKLYDAMLEWSIPVYCGDPYIDRLFNTKSFINGFDILKPGYGSLIRSLEKNSQMDFVDFRPGVYNSIPHHFKRKLKIIGRELKMKLEFNGLNYKKLVDKIVEIDEDENLYREMLLQPWFKKNQVPAHTSAVDRWVEIFG
ncbi:MAG TPA: glycosyltransferase family 10, partial [Mucilaginibacter sp.]